MEKILPLQNFFPCFFVVSIVNADNILHVFLAQRVILPSPSFPKNRNCVRSAMVMAYLSIAFQNICGLG